MSNKLVLHSGGMDSLACMLDYIKEYGQERVISLGFNYGQRHFEQENKAAFELCSKYNVFRKVLNVDIAQIGGSSLIDKNIEVTQDMNNQRSTVVPQRNAIFMLFASAFAQENNCDDIVHGACKEDHVAYRDCRSPFFNLLEMAIQAGRTQPKAGNENICEDIIVETKHDKVLVDDICDGICVKGGAVYIPQHKLDIKISTPLINETKETTMKHIIKEYGIDVYKHSYTCYNGGELSCGVCPACQERLTAFRSNNLKDPLSYGCNIV